MIFKRRTLIIFSILAAGAFIIGMLFLHSRHIHFGISQQQTQSDIWNDQSISSATLVGADESVFVTIARTQADQEQGLSDTLSLPENAGKLFVFDHDDRYGFWMKDMHYGLDLVWIDSGHRIIDISKSVAASTYPQIFYPSAPVRDVLEVNAGFSTAHHLEIGTVLTLKK